MRVAHSSLTLTPDRPRVVMIAASEVVVGLGGAEAVEVKDEL
jgi:hypothetical protein